jgi:zinc protease
MSYHPFRIFFAAASALLIALLGPAPADATTIERVKSPGGIEAWLVREPSVPLIAMDFAFKGGADQDPANKPGVGYMTTALLDDGAGDLDAKSFQQKIEEYAVEMRFSTGRSHVQGSLRVLKEWQAQGFDLLRLALTAPRFDADAIERTRAQVLSGLRRETTSPNDISNRTWWRTAFPNHPYGRPSNGTLESVPQITAEDLKGYARRVLARETLKVAVVGDIDAATLGPLLDRVFGGLPAKAELDPISQVTMLAAGRRIVVDLDVPQAVLTFGGPGLARKDPDFITAFVVNHILGGGSFTSRLYEEVREKRGLAYGVYSYLLPLDHAALVMAGTATSADQAGETLGIIEREIRRLADQGPTAAELAKAKAYLKGSYALRFDTSTKIAGQLLQIQLDELGIDYINKRNSLIDAVTLEDAKRVSKRLFNGEFLVTVVGRPKGLSSKEPASPEGTSLKEPTGPAGVNSKAPGNP